MQALSARFEVALTPPSKAVPIEAVVLPPSRLGDAARGALETALGKAAGEARPPRNAPTTPRERVFADLCGPGRPAGARAGRRRLSGQRRRKWPRCSPWHASTISRSSFRRRNERRGRRRSDLAARRSAPVLALDTARLDKLLALDDRSLTATFQSGIDGPSLEAELGDRGYALGISHSRSNTRPWADGSRHALGPTVGRVRRHRRALGQRQGRHPARRAHDAHRPQARDRTGLEGSGARFGRDSQGHRRGHRANSRRLAIQDVRGMLFPRFCIGHSGPSARGPRRAYR